MRTLIVLVVAAVVLAGCGHKKRARVSQVPRPPRNPVVVQPGQTEDGIASWYGHPYHGRAAALLRGGRRFAPSLLDSDSLACGSAHWRHPWRRVFGIVNCRKTEGVRAGAAGHKTLN